jgi:hypothetical protein
VRRDDAGASGGGNGFHAATVLDTQDATGLIWTGRANERLEVRLFLVVRDGDHGVLGKVGRGRQGPLWLVGQFPIQHNGRGRVVGGRWERAWLRRLRRRLLGSFVIRTHPFLVLGRVTIKRRLPALIDGGRRM